ncbi:hypothetical protein ABKA04_007635 [Annulohypoxylon sp. FPYF3050]
MASIGQVNAAAASLRGENTNALINVNLELNLFTKRFIKPPREYAEVGQYLAPNRLREAEGGTRHTIARKLGILFKDSNLPSSPELIKAYGLRSSEIARNSVANPCGDVSHGPFAGMIGADATTLWAAATSGRFSIQCHLLACLLARIWEPAEATSIWVEIVSRRKEELKLKLDEEGELSIDVVCILTEDLSRSDLRDWDASVRAWMRVADSVMVKRQTQARLIVDNVSLPVNAKPDTYESVMSAWYSSMIQMEKLLNGIPLQVHGGDVLLALLSWHLYPDMVYLSMGNQRIEQNDPLLKGRGILTLGLEPSPRVNRDRKSVYWTLPLSHLRYYGRLPVTRTQSIRTSDRDRITINELLWAKISAYIIDLDDGSVATEEILDLLSDFMLKLHKAYQADDQRHTHRIPLDNGDMDVNTWMAMIHRICLEYKDRLGEERVCKLKAMGRRFVVPSKNPLCEIFSVSTYLEVAQNIEDKVVFLREIADSMPCRGKEGDCQYFIAFKRSYTYPINGKTFEFVGYEYATARPKYDILDNTWSHRRWLSLGRSELSKDNYCDVMAPRIQEIKGLDEEVVILDCFYLSNDYSTWVIDGGAGEAANIHYQNLNRIKASSDNTYGVIYGDIETLALIWCPGELDPLESIITQEDEPQPLERAVPDSGLPLKWRAMQLFCSSELDWFKLFDKSLKSGAAYDASLLGMLFIENLYRGIADATVDVRAAQIDLSSALWCISALARHHETTTCKIAYTKLYDYRPCPKFSIGEIDTAICFACIAMMETGSYNLSPDELRNVFAIGVADSLYIASALVQDPINRPSSPIKRFTGNIGRAGMAFMVPPKTPEIKSYDAVDEWYQYEHKEFDGTMEDCFGGTSLHLSFSEASQAINIGFSGGRDIEAYFLETLVSVHDRGTWIAELDILKTLRSPPDYFVREYLGSNPCTCDPDSARGLRIVSIDNFAEMIIPPMKAGIVRASGNWQARLAAASICLAKGYKVVLKSEETCWGCLVKATHGNCMVGYLIQTSKEVVIIL